MYSIFISITAFLALVIPVALAIVIPASISFEGKDEWDKHFPTFASLLVLSVMCLTLGVHTINNDVSVEHNNYEVFCKTHNEKYKSHEFEYYVDCSKKVYKYKDYQLWLEELKM